MFQVNPLLGRGFTWKNQALFSLKDKSKKLKCRLLQFLLGALRVKNIYFFQVKTQLHHRLQELQPLPEMLKSTELKLHDTEDRLMVSERKNGDNNKLIAELSAKVLLTLLHSERPKLNRVLAVLSAVGFNMLTLIVSTIKILSIGTDRLSK